MPRTIAAGDTTAPSSQPPAAVAPLFRRVDWLTFVITTLAIAAGYYLTLAPEVTLEDSGELATASFYAGIPHSPGYPVWTLYTWLWTMLIPFGSVAWRVALGEATAGAVACGLIGLVVSRGSSLILEGINVFKNLDRRREKAICVVAGFVAGLLLGYNGFMWSQSVIVEVYSFSVLSLMGVMTCLLRWMYAPHQRRYLYWAFFVFGICFTNHQTLLLAAMGLEVAVLVADSKLGRDLFLGNGIVYLGGLIWKLNGGLSNFDNNQSLFNIYHFVGIGSFYVFLWYSLKAGRRTKLLTVLAHAVVNVAILAVWINGKGKGSPLISDNLSCVLMILINPVGIGLIYLISLATGRAERAFTEIRTCLLILVLWLIGAGFYFYMPISSMTNPPMNWSYPRTVEGFFHAVSRGQYERTVPSDLFTHPWRFIAQLQILVAGISDEFNWVYALIVLVPFLFFRRMRKRERGWLIAVTAIYLFLGVFLTIMLNPELDRESRDVVRVFYTASHVMVGILIGYGLALISAALLVWPQGVRKWIPCAAVFLLVGACDTLFPVLARTQGGDVSGLGFEYLAWGAAFAVLAVTLLRSYETGQIGWLAWGSILGAAAVALVGAGILEFVGGGLNLAGNVHVMTAGIGHVFTYGDSTLEVYGALIVVFVVIAALGVAWTGRKRLRFGWLLTAIALMPLYSVLSHWFDNEQRGHLFGYWFGHDMFTPPFVGPDGKFSYDPALRDQTSKGPNGALVYPEMARDAILFGGTDPGRFCPTYMIFCESFVPPRCKPEDPLFDRRDAYIITQNALADTPYLDYIRAQYSPSTQTNPPFFQELLRTPGEVKSDTRTNLLARLAGAVLDRPLESIGARVGARRRREGVYPAHAIYTPSMADFNRDYTDYAHDAERRLHHDIDSPQEPRQVQPGEDVSVQNGQVHISGEVAVFALNGLLARRIFDRNPGHEFYLEQSYPIDWMYPYLTPFGTILKINREPVPEITADMVRRDHEFWSHYSGRLIGNWITYDTSVQDIVAFVDKVYGRHELDGFRGDRKFLRDDVAQKAFSKLRSSIAGLYFWRTFHSAATNPVVQQRMVKEADFAFRQSFAFCPFSPEATIRYVNLLMGGGRLDDAYLIASTCRKLDPNNGSVAEIAAKLEHLNTLIQQVRADPSNFQNALDLASACIEFQRVDSATQILDGILASPNATAPVVSQVAQIYYQKLRNLPKVEQAFDRLAQLEPNDPEIWCNLAALKVSSGKNAEAIAAVRHALDANTRRLASQPGAADVRPTLAADDRLTPLHDTTEWKALFPGR